MWPEAPGGQAQEPALSPARVNRTSAAFFLGADGGGSGAAILPFPRILFEEALGRCLSKSWVSGGGMAKA